jgi:quercetin dioxygenase-like cupin family protein
VKFRPGRISISCIALFIGGSALAQDPAMGILKPFSSVQFSPDSDVKCLLSAIESGNPATGPSTLILKAPAGCVVPWHSHSAQEQALMVSGTILAEMTGRQPMTLGPGGFAAMAGGMAHQFTCQSDAACLMFVTFNRAYDIFWGKGG